MASLLTGTILGSLPNGALLNGVGPLGTPATVVVDIGDPSPTPTPGNSGPWTPANLGGISLMSDDEITMIEAQGGWTTIARPFVGDTAGNGLDTLFTALGTPKANKGFDFGNITPENSMNNLEDLPEFNVSQQLLKMNSSIVANDGNGNHVVSGRETVDGGIDFVEGAFEPTVPVIIRDCFIKDIDHGLGLGIDAKTTLPVLIENTTVGDQGNRNINISNGTIDSCLVDGSGFDCFGVDGSDTVTIRNTMALRPADPAQYGGTVPIPGPHADIMQGNRGVKDLSITGCTFYMPHFDSPFAETNAEMNAVIYLTPHNTAGETNIFITEDVYILGNLLVGGNQTVSMRPRDPDCEVKNVVLAFNRYGSPENGWIGGGNIRFTKGNQTGKWSNIAVFEEFTETGGKAIASGTGWPDGQVSQTPINDFGVFSFNKAEMSDKWREAMWRIGLELGVEILDINGDLNPAFDRGELQLEADLASKTEWFASDFIANNFAAPGYAEVGDDFVTAARDGTNGGDRGAIETELLAGTYRVRGNLTEFTGAGNVTAVQLRLQRNGVNIVTDSGPNNYIEEGLVDSTFTLTEATNAFRFFVVNLGRGFTLTEANGLPLIEKIA